MPWPGLITADWQNLVLLSWPIDDSAVTRLLPRGLEIDRFNGDAFVSAVGLTISNLRVLGVPTWPTRFEQVNFRFYVRQRLSSGGYRRGVVFLKQLVPHRTTALTARLLYGEPFARVPISHGCWEQQACLLDAHRNFAYSWERNGRTEGFWAETDLAAEFPETGSLTEFLTVRHWGYNGRPGDNTKAYKPFQDLRGDPTGLGGPSGHGLAFRLRRLHVIGRCVCPPYVAPANIGAHYIRVPFENWMAPAFVLDACHRCNSRKLRLPASHS